MLQSKPDVFRVVIALVLLAGCGGHTAPNIDPTRTPISKTHDAPCAPDEQVLAVGDHLQCAPKPEPPSRWARWRLETWIGAAVIGAGVVACATGGGCGPFGGGR